MINVQRACEAVVDMANHLVRRERLGVVQSARESFDVLATAGYITPELAGAMKHTVGFRNLAVHDYQRLLRAVAERVIQRDLDDLLAFSEGVVRRA